MISRSVLWLFEKGLFYDLLMKWKEIELDPDVSQTMAVGNNLDRLKKKNVPALSRSCGDKRALAFYAAHISFNNILGFLKHFS